jgi:hypothetical protein
MMQNTRDESTEYLGTEEFDHFSSDDEIGEGRSPAKVLANHIAKYMTPKNKMMTAGKHFNFSTGDAEGEL